MAADAAGNDLLNVFIPVTGALFFAPYGTALPTTAALAVYGYAPASPWKAAGLITLDGGFGWSDNRADAIEFFQDGYQLNAGNGTASLAVKMAETSANVRLLLRNATADANGGIDIDIDADVQWSVMTKEVDKLGNIRWRAAGNAWLTTNASDRSKRGDANANEATFTVRRDPNLANKHYREVLVPLDAAPNPYIVSILPSGAAVGADVLVRGTYLGTSGDDITAFTIDGKAVVAKVWIDAQNVIATIPADVSGASDVIITTTSGGGASNTYAYTAAGA